MNILIQIKESFLNGMNTLLTLAPDLPMYIALIIFLFGAYKVFLEGESGQYMGVVENYVNMPSEEDEYFRKIGSKLTANRYTFFLYIFGLGIFLMFALSSAVNGSIEKVFIGIFFGGLLIFLLRPKKYLFGEIKSLFAVIIDIRAKRRKESLDRELFNSITTLKNLAIAQEEDAISADLMIEKLMDNSKKLKPIYAETLSIYRSGDQTKALNFFGNAIGTKNGKTFALTLEKLDKVNPAELKTQVASLQEVMSEERYTRGLEKAENRGTIIYALATGSCFVCLINFLLVCVLMDVMNTLGDLF